ncbi:hypothetical protein AAH005_20260 [Bacteroides thetaiotaomicron]|uniref:hypothetical protein n=1 Tax=Bacteroides thetaiotaomicron TaxID=818 RepID=UPI00232CD58E|nr:hypothetical protein [Bacteroides thetaiotaomicron]MDC2018138.1 hypothetical protein [Bacteroides thetaiotaomicron]MDC2035926.1 hypothetical protein [Bacteroides thetaiotaomicron]MDC2053586.1 hypothetical protein [Bacteroides thetaiotaomicron]MDC2057997.1 hypothetical protein [Bacteroides thetaiotaomicron]
MRSNIKRTEPSKRDEEKCISSRWLIISRRALIKSKANRDKARDSKRDRLQPFYPATYQRVSVLRWNVPGQVEGQDKGQTIRKRNTNQLTKQPTTNQRATGLPAPK